MSLKRLNNPLSSLANGFTLWLAVILSAGLLFSNISKSSVWHDEGYTMMLAPQSPSQIVARTAEDVHPPLHYLVLHYWMELFGNSEVATRGLSAVLILATVVVGFLLAKRLFDDRTARLAAIFLAVGPFLIRYGQEARMYAMVAFWMTLATWILVKALQDKRGSLWVWYAIAVAGGLYTHYYTVFLIAAHWLYMLLRTKRGRGLGDLKWWGANVLAAGLFLPWVPAAYGQFTRVQGGFWIGKPNILTIPSTVAQFFTFTDLGVVPAPMRLIAAGLFVLLLAWIILRSRDRISWVLIAAFTFLGPLAVYILSFKRPIYVDRYFVFAAVGFYILLAAMISSIQKSGWRKLAVSIVLVVLAVGVRNVYSQSTHPMREAAAIVNSGHQAGDAVVVGELYAYFDFSYYNRTGEPVRIYSPGGYPGCCEARSLLYDRPEVRLDNWADLKPASGHVWIVVARAGKNFYEELPSFLEPASPQFVKGGVVAQRFKITGSQ